MPGRALMVTPLLLALIACAKESEPRSMPTGGTSAHGGAGEKIAIPGLDSLPTHGGADRAMPLTPGPGGVTAPPTARDTSFVVSVIPPAPGKAGAPLVAKVRATPGPGYHMNHEYPAGLKVATVEGITADKPAQDLDDVATLTDEELIFEVKLTAAKAGTYTVPAEFKFAVCTDKSCDPKKQSVAIAVTAE